MADRLSHHNSSDISIGDKIEILVALLPEQNQDGIKKMLIEGSEMCPF